MTAARKITIADIRAMTDAELDELADLLDKRRRERRAAKRSEVPVIVPSDTDKKAAEQIARRLGLRVRSDRW